MQLLTCCRYLYASLPPALVLGSLGAVLAVLDLGVGPTLAGDRSDADPLLQLTIAPIAAGAGYQYYYVLLVFVTNLGTIVLLERLTRLPLKQQGQACICGLDRVHRSLDPEVGMVRRWRDRAMADRRGCLRWLCYQFRGCLRWLCYQLGLLPLLIFMSIPMVGCESRRPSAHYDDLTLCMADTLLTNIPSELVPAVFQPFKNPYVRGRQICGIESRGR